MCVFVLHDVVVVGDFDIASTRYPPSPYVPASCSFKYSNVLTARAPRTLYSY